MAINLWALAIILTKLTLYISFASLIGGFFVIWLFATQARGAAPRSNPFALAQRLTFFLLIHSVLGLVSVTLFFLLQVGLINQNGLAGMFDWFMSSIVMQSAIGQGSVLKAAGFVGFGLAALALHYSLRYPQYSSFKLVSVFVLLLGVASACAGFAELGHIVSLGVVEQWLIAIHVLAIAMWVGAFYPLMLVSKTEPGATVHAFMKRFGDWGWLITVSLSVAGGYLLTQLLASPLELINTAYGALLLLKVLLVLCLLGLAALNKFRLVPALSLIHI